MKMQTITSASDLKKKIQMLESEHAAEGRKLKEQLYATYEIFKPVNLLRSTIGEITSSPKLTDNILATTVGMATGLVSNLVFKGLASPGLRRIISPVLQSGVTTYLAKHSGSLRSMGELALLRIFRKEKTKAGNRDI